MSSAVTIVERSQMPLGSSGICSMNRSRQPSSIARSQQRGRLVVVDAAHEHGVDLHRRETGAPAPP